MSEFQCVYCSVDGRCIYPSGHGGEHEYLDGTGRDRSDDIRIRVLRDRANALESQLASQSEALKAAEATNQRLADLVRYKRHELHLEGLLTDEEYAEVMQIPGAVNRLEGYDGIKAELKAAEEKNKRLEAAIASVYRVKDEAETRCAEHEERWEAERDSLRSQLEAFRNAVPQTWGEVCKKLGAPPPCEPHEWDNRTTAENAVWALVTATTLAKTLAIAEGQLEAATGIAEEACMWISAGGKAVELRAALAKIGGNP